MERLDSRDVKGGERWHLMRRSIHVILSFGVVYYWLPDPLFVEDVPKWIVLLAAVFLGVLIEFVRIKKKRVFPGMRSYEETRLGAYLYAVLGEAIVLAIAPVTVGVPCIIAMALSDPLAGELRQHRVAETKIAISTAVSYALIALVPLIALGTNGGIIALLLLVMTPLAVLSEQIDIKHLDDDFTMLVVPAVAGTLLLLIV